jgi:hypothetical protein
MKFRVPIFKESKFDKFDYHEIRVTKGSNSYAFGNCQFVGEYEIKEPEFSPMLKDMNSRTIYVNDIVDVCIFRVSPENTDDDHHYRGVIGFENGNFVINIYAYLYSNTGGKFIPLKASHLPFYDEELSEDGTYTLPFTWFVGLSGNFATYNTDNVEIQGNIHKTPELL